MAGRNCSSPDVRGGAVPGLADQPVLQREKVKAGPNPERVGWLLADVQAWLDGQAEEIVLERQSVSIGTGG